MKHLRVTVLILFLFSLSAIGGYFIAGYRFDYLQAQKSKIAFEARKKAWFRLEQSVVNEMSRFNGETGIVVKDLDTNWEISFNKDKLFPSASLAKVPIMAACFLAAEQGRFKLDRNIALKSADKFTGSGLLKDMPAGSAFSVERLIGLMIYDSDNTATNIVTNLAGIDYLNSTFKVFGLKNTKLSRKIADYQSRDKGIENYTTAGEMALLLEKIYRGTLGNKKISDQCIGILKLTRMNDRIPKYFPADVTIAHKTGLEKGVCHDAGILFARKGNFIIVVLTRHANSTGAPSKEFIAKVSLHTYNYLEQF